MRIIRILPHPSVLDILDDPDLQGKEIDCILREFAPRERDHGQTSFWRGNTETEFEHVIAGYSGRRKRPDKLSCLMLEDSIFSSIGLDLRCVPDPETFSCISNLHFQGDFTNQERMKQLASSVVRSLCGEDTRAEPKSFSKSEVTALIKRVAEACKQSGLFPEGDRASEWARSLIKN